MSELKKRYGLVTAICMVAGIVIGSGIFFKAQTILQVTEGNVLYGVIAWIIGGIIMLSCVLAFSVMAQKYEKVNGVVDYAEATVGHRYAYYIGWFMSIIYYPTLVSVLAWLTARYALTFFVSVNPNFVLTIPAEEGGCIAGPEVFVLAMVFMVASYALNVLSPRLSGKFQVSTTFIKLIPLILMAVFGTIYGFTHDITNTATPIIVSNFQSSTGDLSVLFPAIVATAFAYEGWIVATSINSELKNSKRNLPIALIVGGLIIIAVYLFYFIGVTGGTSVDDLMENGATVAFTKVFGPVFGNILNLFVAISCMGTLNGLMLGCSRGFYSIASRDAGPKPHVFKSVDKHTNMPSNAATISLLMCTLWFFFFYGGNLAPNGGWFGFFNFDSSELPICTTYALYLPIFIIFMIKAKDVSPIKRFVLPTLAIIGSCFMIFAAFYAHGFAPFMAAKAEGKFACPIIAYLIVFAIIMIIGKFLSNKNKIKEN